MAAFALTTLLTVALVLALGAIGRRAPRRRRAKGFLIEGSAAYPTLRRMP